MLQISSAELVKQLRNRFGIRGATDLTLSEQIIPVANIGDMNYPPYHVKRSGVCATSFGPVAAQLSYIGLRAGSNLQNNFRAVVRAIQILTVNQLTIHVVDNVDLDASLGAPTLTPVQGGWELTPGQTTERPSLQQYTISNALSYGITSQFQPPAIATNPPILLDWVIQPGQTLLLQTTVVNVNAFASFYWDEYYVS